MPRTVAWSDLRIGLIALAALVTAALSILLFARVGALHGDTGTLYVLTDRATGVLPGTEVWLSGEKVGLVKEVRFRPAITDTTVRLAIETEILDERMPLIRRNSYVDIRPGGNLIGSPVIYIGPGSTAAPAIRSGDTLVARPMGAIANVTAKVEEVEGRVTTLLDSARQVMALLNSPASNLGAFQRSGIPQLSNASATASRMMAKASTGRGTIALARRGDLAARFGRIAAAKDSVTMLLSSGNGNVGRFRRDSTLLRSVASIQADLDSLRTMAGNRSSVIARARGDTLLQTEMAKMKVELDALMQDIRKHPLRYLSF